LPVRSRVPVTEGDHLQLIGLGPKEMVLVGGVEFEADARGELVLRPSDHEDFRCHIGLLPVVASDGRSFEFDIAPGKMTREQFDLLRTELQAVWAGIILDPAAVTGTSAMANPADRIWDQRTRSALDSLVAVPPTQLRPVTALVPLDRARQLGAPDAMFVRSLQTGRPTACLAPAPVLCSRELGFVRDTLERLRALATRQRGLVPSGSALAGRLDDTTASVSRYLEHPTLQVSRFDGRPTHLLRSDRRLRRFVELRAALASSDAPVVEGPGELRLGIRGLDRLYELWVFLATAKEAIARFGAPLRGLEALAHRLGSDRLRLHIADGAELVFPGGIRVVFNPAVRTNPALSWAGLELSPVPSTGSPPNLATPDVLVLGPRNDALVIDAKYRARFLVDAAAVEIHMKYSRFRRGGEGVVTSVVAAHPHPGLIMKYAGYSMLPFVPGEPLPDLPWPIAEHNAAALPEPSTQVAPREDAGGPVPKGAPLQADDAAPSHGESGEASGPTSTTAVSARVERPDVVIVDQSWLRQAIGSRRLDFSELAVFTGAGPQCPGYFVGYGGPGVEGLLAAARARGWRTKSAESTTDVLRSVEELVQSLDATRVVVVSQRPELLGLLWSLCDEVEVIGDLTALLR
jgi:hypothetical protein